MFRESYHAAYAVCADDFGVDMHIVDVSRGVDMACDTAYVAFAGDFAGECACVDFGAVDDEVGTDAAYCRVRHVEVGVEQ